MFLLSFVFFVIEVVKVFVAFHSTIIIVMTLINAHEAEHPTKDMGFSPDCLNGTSVPYAV